jgi:hypothetical protein
MSLHASTFVGANSKAECAHTRALSFTLTHTLARARARERKHTHTNEESQRSGHGQRKTEKTNTISVDDSDRIIIQPYKQQRGRRPNAKGQRQHLRICILRIFVCVHADLRQEKQNVHVCVHARARDLILTFAACKCGPNDPRRTATINVKTARLYARASQTVHL